MTPGLEPGGMPPAAGEPPISEAAERARERLHQEIERVRAGVEEMLAEQEVAGSGADTAAVRRELDELRGQMRSYVKRRVRKSERRIDKRVGKLEDRIDQIEQDRQYAEWRIHTNTEAMLDSLLREIRSIADLLSRR